MTFTTRPAPLAPVQTGIVDIHHDDRGYDLAAAARGGLVALIHKATEGCTFRDNDFYSAMNAAEDAKILRGAYHFARGTSDAVDQAEVFITRVRGLARHDDILLALDLEGELDDPRTPEDEAPSTMDTEDAARFVEHVHTLTGRWPLLYAGLSKLRTRMKRTDDATRATLGRCPLWLAAYGPTPQRPSSPSPGPRRARGAGVPRCAPQGRVRHHRTHARPPAHRRGVRAARKISARF